MRSSERRRNCRTVERLIVRQTGRLDWDYIREQLQVLAELKEQQEILNELERRRAAFETEG